MRIVCDGHQVSALSFPAKPDNNSPILDAWKCWMTWAGIELKASIQRAGDGWLLSKLQLPPTIIRNIPPTNSIKLILEADARPSDTLRRWEWAHQENERSNAQLSLGYFSKITPASRVVDFSDTQSNWSVYSVGQRKKWKGASSQRLVFPLAVTYGYLGGWLSISLSISPPIPKNSEIRWNSVIIWRTWTVTAVSRSRLARTHRASYLLVCNPLNVDKLLSKNVIIVILIITAYLYLVWKRN